MFYQEEDWCIQSKLFKYLCSLHEYFSTLTHTLCSATDGHGLYFQYYTCKTRYCTKTNYGNISFEHSSILKMYHMYSQTKFVSTKEVIAPKPHRLWVGMHTLEQPALCNAKDLLLGLSRVQGLASLRTRCQKFLWIWFGEIYQKEKEKKTTNPFPSLPTKTSNTS